VDLVKGIATRAGSGRDPRKPAVDEDTLRRLALQWGSDTPAAAANTGSGAPQREDWSRTVEALRDKSRAPNQKKASLAQNVQQQKDVALALPHPGGAPPRLLDSSASKDFLSIMSSITDAELV
jgi:hypothetical protein